MIDLTGFRLRYLIGTDRPGDGAPDLVTEVGYDVERPVAYGPSIRYCNLFRETYSEDSPATRALFGPYLHTSNTADEYDEGQIDPAGTGWLRNVNAQIVKANEGGFPIVEWDNPDAYDVLDVLDVYDRTRANGLAIMAKNPGLLGRLPAIQMMSHDGVVGVIVEKGAGTPTDYANWRIGASRPTLPIYFVAFGDGKAWIELTASVIAEKYANMSCTYSSVGEYCNAKDVPA